MLISHVNLFVLLFLLLVNTRVALVYQFTTSVPVVLTLLVPMVCLSLQPFVFVLVPIDPCPCLPGPTFSKFFVIENIKKQKSSLFFNSFFYYFFWSYFFLLSTQVPPMALYPCCVCLTTQHVTSTKVVENAKVHLLFI